MTHTPGPWAFVNNNLLVTENRDGSIPLDSVIITVCREINEADARLIVAAPALLEALESVVGIWDAEDHPIQMPNLRAQIEKARDAIAQATGEIK